MVVPPKNITTGTRVKTRGQPHKFGTVLIAEGKQAWSVKLDTEKNPRVYTSRQLTKLPEASSAPGLKERLLSKLSPLKERAVPSYKEISSDEENEDSHESDRSKNDYEVNVKVEKAQSQITTINLQPGLQDRSRKVRVEASRFGAKLQIKRLRIALQMK
jgi:hypothetical protein